MEHQKISAVAPPRRIIWAMSSGAETLSNVMSEEELREMAELVSQVESVGDELPEEEQRAYLDARGSVLHARAVGAVSIKGCW